MKKLLFVLSIVAISLAFSSCNKNGGGAASSGGGKSQGDVVIRVATRFSTDAAAEVFYREKVEEFSKMDNGIRVEMDNIVTESQYLDKLRASFASGDTPNVFQEYGGSRTLDYLEAGALLDLKPYLMENNSTWYNNFYSAFWANTMYEGYPGIYAVPVNCYMVALFYNKDIFAKYNVQPPRSLDEMFKLCEMFKSNGIYPFYVGEKDAYRFGHFHTNLIVKMLGVDAVKKLASRELAYDSPEMIETYRVIERLVKNGYFGDDILDVDGLMERTMFNTNGNIAMKFDLSNYVPNSIWGTDFYDHVGVVPFPYGDEKNAHFAQGGASSLLFVSKLNKSEKEIAASIEFLKYVTSPQFYAERDARVSDIVPVKFDRLPGAKPNPLLDEVVAIQSTMTEMVTDAQNYDPASHMLDTVRSALQGIAMGNTAEQCGAAIVQRMKDFER